MKANAGAGNKLTDQHTAVRVIGKALLKLFETDLSAFHNLGNKAQLMAVVDNVAADNPAIAEWVQDPENSKAVAAQLLEEFMQRKHPGMSLRTLKVRWEMCISKLRILYDKETSPTVQTLAQWFKDLLTEVNAAWQVMRSFLEPAQVTAISSMEEWEKLYKAGNQVLREHSGCGCRSERL